MHDSCQKKNTGTVVGQCRRRLSGAVVPTLEGPLSKVNSGQDQDQDI